MGAWAEGLAANARKEAARRDKVAARRERFRKKFLDMTLKEMAEGEIKRPHFTTEELYLLCLHQIMINQRAMLNDTSARHDAMGNTSMILELIEHKMIGD